MLIKYFLDHKKALTLCAGALVIALTLYPMFYRTWAFGSDAWGLSVIAILDPEEVPWSPSDFNSLAIRPAVAYWLLTNFDWPYERCGKAMTAMDGCSQPLVNFVGTTLDTHEPDSIMTRRGYGLLRHFAARATTSPSSILAPFAMVTRALAGRKKIAVPPPGSSTSSPESSTS